MAPEKISKGNKTGKLKITVLGLDLEIEIELTAEQRKALKKVFHRSAGELGGTYTSSKRGTIALNVHEDTSEETAYLHERCKIPVA